METKEQSKLKFQGVDFVRVDFRAAKKYSGESDVNLKIEPGVFYPEDRADLFNILMDVFLSSNSFFDIKVSAVGHFSIEEGLSDEERRGCVNANAPAIMFPYVRSFISTLTANLGRIIEPLVIPTQFFKGELEEVQFPDNSSSSVNQTE